MDKTETVKIENDDQWQTDVEDANIRYLPLYNVQGEIVTYTAILKITEDQVRVGAWYFNPYSGYVHGKVKQPDGSWLDTTLHRHLMNAPPGSIVNHIDRDRTNNTLTNLEFVDAITNGANLSKSTLNTTGFMGVVYWPSNCPTRPWRAQYAGKYIGAFATAEAAAFAYDEHKRAFIWPKGARERH